MRSKHYVMFGIAVALAFAADGVGARSQQTPWPAPEPPAHPWDLSDLFRPGAIFQDRNGDGVIDFVAAHLVLGADPDASDVASAADVAARRGFETAAMNLPLT